MSQQQQTIIRRTQLPEILGLSMATIDRLRADGGFPKPIKLGVQAVGFLRSDIDSWVANRPVMSHYTETI